MNRWANPSDTSSLLRVSPRRAGCRALILCVCPALLLSGLGAGHSRSLAQDAGEIAEPFGQEVILPPPRTAGNSVELCLNSRYSIHNLGGVADLQQIGHVLWATAQAPMLGAYRRVWVATPNGTYLYDPARHVLVWKKADTVTGAAFKISYEAELAFDAGLAYMPAILAAVSLWRDGEVSVVSCPQDGQLCFGVQQGGTLTSEPAAQCSVPADDAAWLPDPTVAGSNHLVEVLGDLRYVSSFTRGPLTLRQISQLLWAGYGCTPHVTYDSKAGLTVPSAYAAYHLTGAMYLASERGVFQYHNRTPGDDPNTRDHRMERLGSQDIRRWLTYAVAGLPDAPCHVVLCLPRAFVGQYYDELEVGFVASNMLIQASAMDLGCHFNAPLSLQECADIQRLMALPADHVPRAVVSVGRPAESEARPPDVPVPRS